MRRAWCRCVLGAGVAADAAWAPHSSAPGDLGSAPGSAQPAPPSGQACAAAACIATPPLRELSCATKKSGKPSGFKPGLLNAWLDASCSHLLHIGWEIVGFARAQIAVRLRYLSVLVSAVVSGEETYALCTSSDPFFIHEMM